MKFTVIVPPVVQAVVDELSPREQQELLEKLSTLERFPRIYRVVEKGRFRRHRRFIVGEWAVYYRVVEREVHVRGLWPARMEFSLLERVSRRTKQ